MKLEVIGDPKTLYPDNEQTLEAARLLVKEGFVVLPYCIDDSIVFAASSRTSAARLLGALAAPIGSGLGIRNPQPTWRSSWRTPTCRSSWTPASAPRATPPWPWSSGATGSS